MIPFRLRTQVKHGGRQAGKKTRKAGWMEWMGVAEQREWKTNAADKLGAHL
jgi:hypothetical protein